MQADEEIRQYEHDADLEGDGDEYVSLSSLKGRVNATRETIEGQQTELFTIPAIVNDAPVDIGIKVELRALGYKAKEKIGKANRKVRDEGDRDLYSAVDVILRATVGFHAETKKGLKPVAPSDSDWISVARLVNPNLGEVTPRQALLNLSGIDQNDAPITKFLREYNEWLSDTTDAASDEVEKSFATTR